MIEIWMKNHLVNDSFCNIVNLWCPKNKQVMTNDVPFTYSVGDTTRDDLHLVLSKTNGTDDTKYIT
jgi:hypothetical protein